MSKVRTILGTILVVMTVHAAAASARGVYNVGDTVADFTLPGLDQQEHNLSDLRGRVVVLNFFATWCVGCNEEAPHLEAEIWRAYENRGVSVVAVNLQEQAALVAGWTQALGLTYPVWMSPDYEIFLLFSDFGAIPHNAVIDPVGVLRYSQTGFDLPALQQVLEDILGEATPAEESSWSALKMLYAE